jgi:hypothetical protein
MPMSEPLSAASLLETLQHAGNGTAGGPLPKEFGDGGVAYSQLLGLLGLQGANPQQAAQTVDKADDDSTQRLALLVQLSQAFSAPDAAALAAPAQPAVPPASDDTLRVLLAALQPATTAPAVPVQSG